MYLPKRDIIATGLVAVAGLVYLLWRRRRSGGRLVLVSRS